MPTPAEWGLEDIERVDVNQADIAPLMATLAGLPCPVNSVRNLPLGYLKLDKAEQVEANLANTNQILNQFLRKSYLKQKHSLHFMHFKPLANYSSVLSQIEDLILARDYTAALKLSQNLRSLSLSGFYYFQTYDWFMLMTVITLGYLGWMLNLIIHVLRSYTLQLDTFPKREELSGRRGRKNNVLSFSERKLYTWLFLFVGLFGALFLYILFPKRPLLAIYIWIACWLLSLFTLMPAEIPDNHMLVVASGAAIVLISFASSWFGMKASSNKVLSCMIYYGRRESRSQILSYFQVFLVILSSAMVWLSTSLRAQKRNYSLYIRPLTGLWLMVLFNVAFFGTGGNFANIASFEISPVYRFITIFSPFLMASLLIFKLFIPFVLVICAFSAITKLIQLPRMGCYFLVILFSDVMTIHFFFLVRNTGSWMEIGNSISHFGIMSCQVVFSVTSFRHYQYLYAGYSSRLVAVFIKIDMICSARSNSFSSLVTLLKIFFLPDTS